MLRVTVIGVESTGKTMISKQLAEWYSAPLLPEYAREYLEKNGNTYQYEDFIAIAQGQKSSEEQFIASHDNASLIITDTDFIVIKIWSEVLYGFTETWITDHMIANLADHYLLCTPDIPWTQDGMREYPSQADRDNINLMYINILSKLNSSFTLIGSSSYAQRFLQAKNAIDKLLALTFEP